MVDNGREGFADLTSMVVAASLLLNHIGFPDLDKKWQSYQ